MNIKSLDGFGKPNSMGYSRCSYPVLMLKASTQKGRKHIFSHVNKAASDLFNGMSITALYKGYVVALVKNDTSNKLNKGLSAGISLGVVNKMIDEGIIDLGTKYYYKLGVHEENGEKYAICDLSKPDAEKPDRDAHQAIKKGDQLHD